MSSTGVSTIAAGVDVAELQRLQSDQEALAAVKGALAAENLTDTELVMFLYFCKRRGLDPLLKQVYPIKRQRKVTKRDPDKGFNVTEYEDYLCIQTGIDGFRVIGQRSQRYRGQVGPFWAGENGEWRDLWLDVRNAPFAAKVGIRMEGFQDPVWGVARLAEYQVKSPFWNNPAKACAQLAKCAEALAWRRACPEDLSGMYVESEMHQADEDAAMSSATIAEVLKPAEDQPEVIVGPVDPVDENLLVAVERSDLDDGGDGQVHFEGHRSSERTLLFGDEDTPF